MARQPVQLELPTWGGSRRGAGRKPKGRVALVSHQKRPEHAARFPVHAVVKTDPRVPRLRRREIFDAVERALRAGANGYVSKNLPIEQLYCVLQRVLAACQQRARRQKSAGVEPALAGAA